jgi:hypothetical protein
MNANRLKRKLLYQKDKVQRWARGEEVFWKDVLEINRDLRELLISKNGRVLFVNILWKP